MCQVKIRLVIVANCIKIPLSSVKLVVVVIFNQRVCYSTGHSCDQLAKLNKTCSKIYGHCHLLWYDGEICNLDIIIRFNSFLFRADTLSSRYGRILSDLLFSPILASRQMVEGLYLWWVLLLLYHILQTTVWVYWKFKDFWEGSLIFTSVHTVADGSTAKILKATACVV